MRRYEALWKELESKRTVSIRCKTAKVPTIVQAVKKEKARANILRKDLELPFYGRMQIKVLRLVDGFSSITFKILRTERTFDL